MKEYLTFYKCRWCQSIYHGTVPASEWSDDVTVPEIAGWFLDRKPIALHFCDGQNPASLSRHGVADFIGVREKREEI